MRWNVICASYPKAFKKFCANRIGLENWEQLGWVVKTRRFIGPEVFSPEGQREGCLADHPHHLVAFFDEAGLFLKVQPGYQLPCSFLAGIITDGALRTVGNGPSLTRFDSRKEAEESALMLAFALMEEKLA